MEKVLGVLASILVLAGLGAGPAAASVFEAESYPAELSGTQFEGKHSFKTVANELYCNKYTFKGELSAAAGEIALAGTPGECSTLGIVVMTVAMNGCTFNFGSGGELGAGLFSGTAKIACPEGKEIVWTASSGNCTAKIPPQTLKGTVTLQNTAAEPKKTVRLTTESSTVHYTLGPSSGCLGSPAPGTYTNGLYKGITKLSALKPGTATALDLTVK